MRRIITKDEKDKKRQRNQLIIGGVMIVLMILSTAGYAITVNEGNQNNEVKTFEYKGIKFIRNGEYWIFSYSGGNFITRYTPKETENITISPLYIANYQRRPLYIVGETAEAYSEVLNNLDPIVERIQPACITNNCTDNRPIKNCSVDNIIVFKDQTDDKTSIKIDEKCIIITADYPERLRYTDSVLYRIIGI